MTRQWIRTVLATGLIAIAATSVQAREIKADSLVAIDRNRGAIIEHIVTRFKETMSPGQAEVVRGTLASLRADHLLAASLAPSLDGLLAAMRAGDSDATKVSITPKALGDPTADLVYTPVVPCRLFDTRQSQNGFGPLVPNVPRTYSATVPVPQQGGPGGCTAPAGAAVAMILISTIAPPGIGLLQGGATGTGPFANALVLYQPGDQYGATIPMPLNVADGRFDIVAQFNGLEIAGDLLGFFAEPQTTALECVRTLDTSQTITPGISPLLTSNQACAAGYTMTGGGCAVQGNALAVHLIKVELSAGNAVRCAYDNLTGTNQTAYMETRCCRIPGR